MQEITSVKERGFPRSGKNMAGENSKVKLRAAVPVFLVRDIASTVQWYPANLGFNARAVPESPPHHFCILRKGDMGVFLQQLDGYRKPDLYQEREGGAWSACVQTQGFHALS
jgi:hypothetical protein